MTQVQAKQGVEEENDMVLEKQLEKVKAALEVTPHNTVAGVRACVLCEWGGVNGSGAEWGNCARVCVAAYARGVDGTSEPFCTVVDGWLPPHTHTHFRRTIKRWSSSCLRQR